MIVYYISLTIVIVFEFWLFPFNVLKTAKAEYYLGFSIFVSLIVLGLTIYSFTRLMHLIKKHRSETHENVS